MESVILDSTTTMRHFHGATSPLKALTGGYIVLGLSALMFHVYGLYNNSTFFSWGPPFTFMDRNIQSQGEFYVLLLIFFIHAIVNNWISEVVYPWIVNRIQDPKSTHIEEYSKPVSLLIINFYAVYSTIDLFFVVAASYAQISFLLVLILANALTVTLVNWKYIRMKRPSLSQEIMETYSTLN